LPDHKPQLTTGHQSRFSKPLNNKGIGGGGGAGGGATSTAKASRYGLRGKEVSDSGLFVNSSGKPGLQMQVKIPMGNEK